MRIDFVSPPFAGHLNPMLPLARAAMDNGHQVRILTGEGKLAVLEQAGFCVKPVAGSDLETIANTPARVGSNPRKLIRQFRKTLAVLPEIRGALRQQWQEHRPDVVVADSVAPIAGLLCEELSIPWITTIATPFAIESPTGTPSYCGGWTPANPLRDAAGRLLVRTFKSTLFHLFRSHFRNLGLHTLYRANGDEAIYSPRAILGFGISELEFPRTWPAAFEMIGPVIESPDAYPPITYHLPRPRILISLGTHLLWAKQTLLAEAAALSRRFPEISLVVSLGDPSAQAPPAPAPRMLCLPFVPYTRDLSAFDAVIHHGGAGVTYASILHGIPACAVPHDYDQFDFAARIVHHGAGHRSPSIAEVPIDRLLAGPWPQLPGLQAAARRYRPAESFLTTLHRIAAENDAASRRV